MSAYAQYRCLQTRLSLHCLPIVAVPCIIDQRIVDLTATDNAARTRCNVTAGEERKNNEHVVRSGPSAPESKERERERERESRSNTVTIMHIQGVDLFNFCDQGRAPVARIVILDRFSKSLQRCHTPAPTGAYIHLRSYYLNSPL